MEVQTIIRTYIHVPKVIMLPTDILYNQPYHSGILPNDWLAYNI